MNAKEPEDRAFRNEIIEECALEIETLEGASIEQIAAAIRALKS